MNILRVAIILLAFTQIILIKGVEAHNVKVAVTIGPLASIVEAIGGEEVSVQTLLPEGVEPHTFQAKPEILAKATLADLIVQTGHFPFEEQLIKVAGKPSLGLREFMDFGLNLSRMPINEHEEHSGGYNLHGYWLKPDNAQAIAKAAASALAKIDPANAQKYQKNLEVFQERISRVKDYINLLKGGEGSGRLKVVVTHPSESYLAETFGMDVAGILSRGENVFVSGGELVNLEKKLRSREVSLIVSSELSSQMKVGEFAEQLAKDTDTPIIYFRVMTWGFDYPALIMFNAGVASNIMVKPKSNVPSTQLLYPIALAILASLALAEAALIVRSRGWRQ
ncbi:zinc ABC transporter substrate-binding protein [Candidatus Bathyarchaeota archaeon]|nr:zinc ABC transporter substrate-binding protein [Candidatus Bathyarchaeota archaeon]